MSKKKRSHQVRIIAGEWRGRKLPVLDLPGLRPTLDRVRETLFNWLMHDISGAFVLDLFAGSGALGMEALSREARHVTFVDSNGQTCRAIESNLSILLGDPVMERAHVANLSAEAFLRKKAQQPFDVVFLDPPFDSDVLSSVCDLLADGGWLSPSGLVYLEWRV